MRRFKLARSSRLTVLILFVVLSIGLFPSSAQDEQPSEFNVRYTHTVNINGEEFTANATGVAKLSDGSFIMEASIDQFIPGYGRWPVSWVTKSITTIMPAIAFEIGGAQNLHSLTGGELGFTATALTENKFANLTSQISVGLEDGVIVAEIFTEGEADYPDIIAMGEGPLRLVQIPHPDGGFEEQGVKSMLTSDGELIQIPYYAKYDGVELPAVQMRNVQVNVLEESEDGLNVTLEYFDTVRPRDDRDGTLLACRGGGFSVEEDFIARDYQTIDGNPYISDGDLLSFNGQICARNADLLQQFDVPYDLGLDAVDVISVEPGLVAFSTELDSPFGTFTAGDLLFTNGARIPNSAITTTFQIPYDIGLDAVQLIGEPGQIVEFAEFALGVDSWEGGTLVNALQEFNLDIWYSIEGTWQFSADQLILDGDLLSALQGIIILSQPQLINPPAPAGIPQGVDYGLDAATTTRGGDRSLVLFSTEIFDFGSPFSDGDLLSVGGTVAVANHDLILPFNPPVRFLGLDAVSRVFREPPTDPNIQTVCGDSRYISDFAGGMAPPNSLNPAFTGYYIDPSDGVERPCGSYVPIDGFLPDTGPERFRVVFREVNEPESAATPIQTSWKLSTWDYVTSSCKHTGTTLTTDSDGWVDVNQYLEAKTGLDVDGDSVRFTDGCINSGLRLAVWDTFSLPEGPLPGRDRDDHYVIWLEWDNGMGTTVQREPVEHHIQLDNTRPDLPAYPDALQVRLQDGTTTVFACGEAPAGTSSFQIWGQFKDDHYSDFRLVIRGGDPPATQGYGPHYFDDPDDGTPLLKNTNANGTIGAGLVHLRDIDMTDLGDSFTDCCYLLEMYVRDRTIRHNFNNISANGTIPWESGPAFVTFSASP